MPFPRYLFLPVRFRAKLYVGQRKVESKTAARHSDFFTGFPARKTVSPVSVLTGSCYRLRATDNRNINSENLNLPSASEIHLEGKEGFLEKFFAAVLRSNEGKLDSGPRLYVLVGFEEVFG